MKPLDLSHLPHEEQVASILTARPDAIVSAWGRLAAAKRQRRSGGRNGGRPSWPRCPQCGKSTLRHVAVTGACPHCHWAEWPAFLHTPISVSGPSSSFGGRIEDAGDAGIRLSKEGTGLSREIPWSRVKRVLPAPKGKCAILELTDDLTVSGRDNEIWSFPGEVRP